MAIKTYEKPAVEIVKLNMSDIIATSGEEGGTGGFIPGGGGVEEE